MKNWYIYIPEEGDWPIDGYSGDNKSEAKAAYLRWAGRKTIPKGARIWSADAGQMFGPLVPETGSLALAPGFRVTLPELKQMQAMDDKALRAYLFRFGVDTADQAIFITKIRETR